MKIIISKEQKKDKDLLKKVFTEEFLNALEEEESKSKPMAVEVKGSICVEVKVLGAVLVRTCD